jgi:hypothetical protein
VSPTLSAAGVDFYLAADSQEESQEESPGRIPRKNPQEAAVGWLAATWLAATKQAIYCCEI